ncbi:protein abrupt isoform X1 [Hylaeus anthracinus]|uniref:protein abrupt isoform X1 n=1 Tax=Hylaeus volcanicus TaxID=313075 RepID=UPI0023B7E160|nr:protein abrupt isoform X1 [Hylaeus volcanicus]XP_053983342.1 protein abrupt isoform X1 [Hylaeus volcanicus]XP_053983343.1 protein abrupt isoform X1 [Hylaeus volcanicus]XP_053983344.1 protein abrupt isoform X1 [Hylaeus volcanicus]XP_054011818.1 protein abrupt isoform X1 [Hylaeus anthracinus]XP_054011819.1 protein abrupt isoform X1 [Hylaeus anthracinus]XP_054011820.1 protein abrupt isoform X1 [Hylaeus anthracinus]XP_054011821.1 protein abrupt isoform X1 [Hylaeus anthracinus]
MAASSSSSSGEQQYSLRWNDFHSSILSSFRHLRDEEDFVDVTLACDSSSFTAHKVVLSACSPYFRRLLKANPCQHPIVILRDVASSDMESLLRFMYHGEVHVGQEQLAAFLKTAQMLQVRGLADVNSAATAKIPPPSSSGGYNGSAPATPRNPWQDNGRGDLNESGLSPPPEKRPRSNTPTLGNHVEPKTDLQDSLLGQALEGGPTLHTTPTNNVQAQSTGEDSNSMSDNEEDMSNNDSILNSVKTEPSDILNDSMEHHRNSFPAALLGLPGLIPGPSGIHAANQDPNYVARRGLDMTRVRATDPRPCPKCGKIYRSAHTLRTHLEDKHTICPGYRCVLCGTVAKSRNSLHSHMSRQHRGISTKDLPVLPMPSPFDPDLASRLLAKAGVKVSPAELRARASPTGPRRGDMRLEIPRGGAPSEAGSSICGGDDPEDLTLPLSLRYGSPTPNNNTVITKVSGSNSSSSAKNSTATAIAAKSLDTMHGSREPNMAPLHPPGHLHPSHHNTSATGSAILDTYLQFIAENSGLATMGLSPEQAAAVAAAHAAKMAHMSGMDKLGRGMEDYPMIGRDEGRGLGVVHDERQDLMQDRHGVLMDDGESSGGEDDDFSENEEPEIVKAE